MTEQQPALPGLEIPEQPAPDTTATERAARIQLDKLRADGRLGDEHIIVEQVILDLARAVGISATKGRAAGVALAARELREFIGLLPKTVSDEFGDLVKSLDAANAEAAAQKPAP